MNRIYSNIKQIALSLLVVGLAIGTQSFKNSKETAKFAAGDIYVNTSDGNYQRIPSADYDPDNCQNSSPQPCAFQQGSGDTNNHGNTLTPAQVAEISSLSRIGSDNGVYVP